MNSSTWRNSPVTEVFASVLAAIFPNRVAKRQHQANLDILITSYSEDFADLWRLDRSNKGSLIDWIVSGGDSLRTIFVVWDKIPESPDTSINVADYVTPFDWAFICSKITLSASRASDRSAVLPLLRLVIIDLDSQEHSGAFACNTFLAVGHALPWIQVYRPTQTDRHELLTLLTIDNEAMAQLRSALAPGALGFETLFADILTYDEGREASRSLSLRAAQTERDRSPIVDSLTHLWQSSLVRPGDRHHVGNLLAPVLLAKGLPGDLERKIENSLLKNNSLHNALKVLVDVIGLEGAASTKKAGVPDQGTLQSLKSDSDIFDRRSNVNVLLVDDQFRLGYQHILSAILFGKHYDPAKAVDDGTSWRFELKTKGALRCVATAEAIIEALALAAPVSDWLEPRLFQLSIPVDILVLDLRLWTDAKERRRFLARLIEVCKKLGASNRGNRGTPLADPAFKRAFERAEAIANAQDVGTSEIESLVLLPLLLSYYDPSVPIILFSSTHQRSILQMISHRKNIFADFAKPILSGYGEERGAAESVEDLKRAIVGAVKLHEARGIWARLIGFAWKISPVFECSSKGRAGGERVLKVYNIPPSGHVNKSLLPRRVDSGRMLPRLDGRDLRVLLAKHFMDYIQGTRHFDFASIPWEILEGNLVPKKILRDPHITNPDFGLFPDLIIPRETRNLIARALEIIRHKKAHGNAPVAVTDAERDDYRIASLLQFSMLLDFVGGASVPEQSIQPTINQLWNRIQRRNKHFFGLLSPLEPNRLTTDARLTWLDFIAYTTLWYATKAVDNGIRFLDAATVRQIERMAQHSLKRP
ncbi:MAG: Cold-shock DNA-binding domain protein [Acidobacteria bacterium]|nr:Cold-shock DNA-binding domain protein [Acidobacteriota bacterium]